MSKKSDSPYGTAFLIRVGVLLAVLLLVGAGVAYDRFILVPSGEDAVERVMQACADANAQQSAVRKAAGCDPTSTEKAGMYEIDDWKFGRILPNLEGYKVSVVYLDGIVAETYRGGISDADRATFRK